MSVNSKVIVLTHRHTRQTNQLLYQMVDKILSCQQHQATYTIFNHIQKFRADALTR